MQVELLVFSGRENPRWELNDTEVRELTKRMIGLPPGESPPEPGALGYRGFLIATSGCLNSFPETVAVYQGVHLGHPEGTDTRRDERGLEAWLLDLARNRGYGELLDSLGV